MLLSHVDGATRLMMIFDYYFATRNPLVKSLPVSCTDLTVALMYNFMQGKTGQNLQGSRTRYKV